MSGTPHSLGERLPTVDISALLSRHAGNGDQLVAPAAIDAACRDVGFFGVVGHGLDPELLHRLDAAARSFFEEPAAVKAQVAMAEAGSAWRGWFPVGGELTSGTPDRKEGLYLGVDHDAEHPRVLAGTPLHGLNQFPAGHPDLRLAVTEWLDALRPVADAVMRGIALGLGLPATWFEEHLTADPTILFRIFHYPPESDAHDASTWGVGEHTDYGLLTLLAQDDHGGLEVRHTDGTWIDVPADPGVIICNLGDMLERLTGGRYRSTPHRVRNMSGAARLSFPYFFDPSWDATVPTLPIPAGATRHASAGRWDDADVLAWTGTYGEYLTAKVARVFPELFADVSGGASRSRSPSGDRPV